MNHDKWDGNIYICVSESKQGISAYLALQIKTWKKSEQDCQNLSIRGMHVMFIYLCVLHKLDAYKCFRTRCQQDYKN